MVVYCLISFLAGGVVVAVVTAIVKKRSPSRQPSTGHTSVREPNRFGRLRTELWKLSGKGFDSDSGFFAAVLDLVGPHTGVDRISYFAMGLSGHLAPLVEWNAPGRQPGNIKRIHASVEELLKGGAVLNVEKGRLAESALPDEGQRWIEALLTRDSSREMRLLPVKVGKKLMGGIALHIAEHSEENLERLPKVVHHLIDDVIAIFSRALEKSLFDSVRLEMEEALRRSESKYRMIFESLHDTYFRTDPSGEITLVSPSCLKVFGYTPEEMLTINFTRDLFFSPEERDGFLKTITAHGQVQEFEAQMSAKDGSLLWVSMNAHFTSTRRGKGGFEGILRDITERKSLEEQLIRAERMAAVGTLAGGVAHEFNNINLAILGYSELGMFRKDLPEDVKNYFKTIRRSALRAKNITSNLLTFSGRKSAGIGSGNLTEVVEETLIMLDHEVSSKGVIIERNFQSVPTTIMDATQIGQVILNMLINAHHSMLQSDDKRITIETGVDQNWVYVKISDKGCGIEPEHLTQIFSPFFSTKGEHSRGDGAHSSVKGTGLGLSISHTIVSNHKGKIDVSSEVGVGTTFVVKLPILPTRKKRDSVPALLSGEGSLTANILILDDEPDLRHLLETFLQTLGHKVFTTGDGEEALSIITANKVDISLVDLQMPKMTGRAFMDRLGELSLPLPPTVLVMTGKVLPKESEEYDPEKVFRVIRKPFKLNEISSHVDDALKERISTIINTM